MKHREPSWMDVKDLPDTRCRTMDEQVEMRRRSKVLADCALPEGFRLVTRRPRQVRLDGQVRYAIIIAWSPLGKDLYFFAQRYEVAISDETQLDWAVSDFSRELELAGVTLKVPRRPIQVLRMAS